MKPLKILLIALFIFYKHITVHAQSDSVAVITYEETAQASSFNKRERFKYLDRSMIEESSMFKISALPHWGGYYGAGINLTLGYERKITRSFSVTGELVNYVNPLTVAQLFSETEYKTPWRARLNASVRYYYGQKKEIRNGTSGNNLLSNYLELKVDDILMYGGVRHFNQLERGILSYPNLILAWGLQRRIRKLGYFDVSLGAKFLNRRFDLNNQTTAMPYFNNRVMPYAKISLGLGFAKRNK
jgi:hypothetical protein